MASKIDIANLALTSIGADRIETLDEDSETARKVNSIYERLLKSMLRSHFWNFATKEIVLSRLVETPLLDDYTYIFQLPSDYIRLRKVSIYPDSYKIKGRRIYCNSDSLSIEYVSFNDDPNEYDALFVDAFATRIAAELCFSITKNATLTQNKWIEFKEKYTKSISVDGQEETPDSIDASSWVNSRK